MFATVPVGKATPNNLQALLVQLVIQASHAALTHNIVSYFLLLPSNSYSLLWYLLLLPLLFLRTYSSPPPRNRPTFCAQRWPAQWAMHLVRGRSRGPFFPYPHWVSCVRDLDARALDVALSASCGGNSLYRPIFSRNQKFLPPCGSIAYCCVSTPACLVLFSTAVENVCVCSSTAGGPSSYPSRCRSLRESSRTTRPATS